MQLHVTDIKMRQWKMLKSVVSHAFIIISGNFYEMPETHNELWKSYDSCRVIKRLSPNVVIMMYVAPMMKQMNHKCILD